MNRNYQNFGFLSKSLCESEGGYTSQEYLGAQNFLIVQRSGVWHTYSLHTERQVAILCTATSRKETQCLMGLFWIRECHTPYLGVIL